MTIPQIDYLLLVRSLFHVVDLNNSSLSANFKFAINKPCGKCFHLKAALTDYNDMVLNRYQYKPVGLLVLVIYLYDDDGYDVT